MRLSQLHQDSLIVEGVEVPSHVVSEGLGRLLLGVARGLGRATLRTVAGLLRGGLYLGAALLGYPHNPSQGFDVAGKDMDDKIAKLSPNDPKKNALVDARSKIRDNGQFVNDISRRYGEHIGRAINEMITDADAKAGSESNPVDQYIRSSQTSAKIINRLQHLFSDLPKIEFIKETLDATKTDSVLYDEFEQQKRANDLKDLPDVLIELFAIGRMVRS